MRATGYPKKAMLSSMLTVGCNIILAPIFIFVLNWGIRGAALATICSQFIGMLWVLYHFYSPKTYIRFQRHSMRLKQHIIANIFAIGMSPFVMNVCACCIVIFINNRLLNYGGDMAIGAFGILNRIQMLFVMIVMGITMGMQPITGYNYGAQHFDRVKRTLKLGITAGCIITTLGFIIGELFPGIFVGMFTDNHELTDEATLALRIGILSLPGGRCTDCHHPVLSVHRKSPDFHLPVSFPPAALPSSGTGFSPTLLWRGRCMVQHAVIRCLGLRRGSLDAGIPL